jgi:hypothetical protein
MPKILHRIAVSFLIPCLLFDSAFSAKYFFDCRVKEAAKNQETRNNLKIFFAQEALEPRVPAGFRNGLSGTPGKEIPREIPNFQPTHLASVEIGGTLHPLSRIPFVPGFFNGTKANGWSASVISSRDEIRSLKEVIQRLVPDHPPTLSPDFFLASFTAKKWIPRVVKVMRGDRIVGIVFLKERRMGGIRLRIAFADAVLSPMTASKKEFEESVFEQALLALFKQVGIIALRFNLPAQGFEFKAAQRVATSMGAEIKEKTSHSHSELRTPGSYKAFLAGLGRSTRQRMHELRNESTKKGYEFVQDIEEMEFHRAVDYLRSVGATGHIDQVPLILQEMSQVDRPLRVGLRKETGEWMAVAGGWWERDRLVHMFQLNHDKPDDHRRLSLGISLQRCLMEMMLENGIHTLASSGAPLRTLIKYFQHIPAQAVHIDRGNPLWWMVRQFVHLLRPHLSPTADEMAGWIAWPPREAAWVLRAQEKEAA